MFHPVPFSHYARSLCLMILCAVISTSLLAQSAITIRGSVTDAGNSQTLPGVNILIKDSSQGTTTDAEGNFTISASAGSTLIFSFIGYITQQYVVNSESSLNVKLETDTHALSEVVVTGYSSQQKKDIVGSVAVVNVKELQSVPSRSAGQALQGMASGVNVIRSGVPGNGSKITIRGVTNFGNTDPLVIVDGIQQDINNISSQDIESIQVLKDAGAAAIYGVRGANGVVLITTKKGKSGKPVINFQSTINMVQPLSGNPFNVLNSQEYMQVYNTAFPNNDRFINGMPDYMYRGPGGAGVAKEGDPAVNPSLYHYASPNIGQNYIIQKVNKEGTDWYGAMFKKAITTEQNLSVNGGTEKSKYLFSLGLLDQKGTLIETSLKRYSARVNTEYTLGKHIRVGENLNVIYRDTRGFSENSDFGGIIETVKMPPIVPLYDIKGNYGGTFAGPALGDAQNPIAVQQRNRKNDLVNQWHILGNIYAEVDLFKDFTLRSSLGYNVVNSFNQDFNTTQVENVQGNNSDNSLNINYSFSRMMTFTNLLTYKKNIGDHNISVVVGTEAIENVGRGVSAARERYFSEDFNFMVLNNGTNAITNSSSVSKNSLFSQFGRIDYVFQDKYILGATIRRDGSSVFGPDKRYGIFPSVSAGWRISGEEFMSNLSWIQDLKLRGSWGVLGSQSNVSAVNAFSLFGSGMSTTYYDINGASNAIVQGFGVSRIGNLATGWEENVVTNLGLDMSILNNNLEFSIEYYKKKINGLLFSQPLPAVVIGGATSPSVNIGDIQNTGIDGSVRYRGKIGSDITYNAGVNITSYQNKVVNIPDPGYFFSGGHQGLGSIVRNEEGHPVSSFYGYRVTGLFNSQAEVDAAPTQNSAAPGRFRYEDINGDGVINSDDRTHLGNPNPDFTYGINLNIGYKRFDLGAFFYGSQGNQIFNVTKAYTHFAGYYPTTNMSRDLLNAWTPENTNTNIPKIESVNTFSTAAAPNSFFIENGSFLKMRSLSLGYTFAPHLIQKVNISNLRLFAQIENLFTITKYSGLDPEIIGGDTSSLGLDRGAYPNNEKGFIFGLSVNF